MSQHAHGLATVYASVNDSEEDVEVGASLCASVSDAQDVDVGDMAHLQEHPGPSRCCS